MEDKILFLLRYIGKKKWRAYLFWYLFGYLAILWRFFTKDGFLSWETLFPFKLCVLYIAYFFAPVNYEAVRGNATQIWVMKRGIKIGVSFLLFVLVAALIEKQVQSGLFWLIM